MQTIKMSKMNRKTFLKKLGLGTLLVPGIHSVLAKAPEKKNRTIRLSALMKKGKPDFSDIGLYEPVVHDHFTIFSNNKIDIDQYLHDAVDAYNKRAKELEAYLISTANFELSRILMFTPNDYRKWI